MRKPVLVGLVITIACATFASVVHAQEGAPPAAPPLPPPSTSPTAISAPSTPDAHELRMRALRARRDELELEAKVERATRERDRARAGDPDPEAAPPRIFEKGRVLFASVGGVGYALRGAELGGLFVSGPISFRFLSAGRQQLTSFGLTPEADVVVGDRLTLGGAVGLSVDTSRFESDSPAAGGTQTTRRHGVGASLEPRIGYVVPLGRGVHVWPRVALRGGHTWSEGDQKRVDLGVQLDAPFVFPLSRHVFWQVAPFAVYGRARTTGPSSWELDDVDSFGFGTYVRLGLAL